MPCAPCGRVRMLRALSDSELIAVHERYCRMRRMLDADQTALAAEIARRSRPELGSEGLAKTQGYRNPTALIAATGGTSTGDAARLVKVGEATAPRQLLSGQTAPARHPHVAEALAGGSLTERAAGAIIAPAGPGRVPRRTRRLDVAEKTLVAQAPGLTMDQLNRVLARAEAWLDPDGVAPREDEARTERSLTIREDRGRVIIHAELDPASAAPIKTAIEALVSAEMRATRDAQRDGTGSGRTATRDHATDWTATRRARRWCRCKPTRSSSSASTRSAAIADRSAPARGDGGGADRPHRPRGRHRVRHDRRDHRPGLGSHGPPDGGGRADHLLRPRRRQSDPGLGPHQTPLHPHPTARAHRTRRRMRDVRGTTRAHQGPPHPVVGTRRRTHRPRTTACCSASPATTASTTTGGPSTSTAPASRAKVWFIPPPHVDPARTPRLGGRARYDYAA